MQTHTHACMYTHTCMINMINMDASMAVAFCNFYTCIHVCACMDMHVHMCGIPPCPQMSPDVPTHLSSPQELQGAQNTKIQ